MPSSSFNESRASRRQAAPGTGRAGTAFFLDTPVASVCLLCCPSPTIWLPSWKLSPIMSSRKLVSISAHEVSLVQDTPSSAWLAFPTIRSSLWEGRAKWLEVTLGADPRPLPLPGALPRPRCRLDASTPTELEPLPLRLPAAFDPVPPSDSASSSLVSINAYGSAVVLCKDLRDDRCSRRRALRLKGCCRLLS